MDARSENKAIPLAVEIDDARSERVTTNGRKHQGRGTDFQHFSSGVSTASGCLDERFAHPYGNLIGDRS